MHLDNSWCISKETFLWLLYPWDGNTAFWIIQNPNCHYQLYLRLLQTGQIWNPQLHNSGIYWGCRIEEAVVTSEQNPTHLMLSSRIWLRFCSVQVIIIVAAISTTTTTTTGTAVPTALILLLLLLKPGATILAKCCWSLYRRQQNMNHTYAYTAAEQLLLLMQLLHISSVDQTRVVCVCVRV